MNLCYFNTLRTRKVWKCMWILSPNLRCHPGLPALPMERKRCFRKQLMRPSLGDSFRMRRTILNKPRRDCWMTKVDTFGEMKPTSATCVAYECNAREHLYHTFIDLSRWHWEGRDGGKVDFSHFLRGIEQTYFAHWAGESCNTATLASFSSFPVQSL